MAMGGDSTVSAFPYPTNGTNFGLPHAELLVSFHFTSSYWGELQWYNVHGAVSMVTWKAYFF